MIPFSHSYLVVTSITAHPTSKTSIAGSNFSFVCEASGYPAPNITWWRGGLFLSELDHQVIIEFIYTRNSTKSKLSLFGLNSTDVGNYTCQATNSFQSQTSTDESEKATLSLLCELAKICIKQRNIISFSHVDPPDVTVDPVEIVAIEDDNVHASCKAFGIPLPSVSWSTGNQSLSSMPRFTVTTGNLSDIFGRVFAITNFSLDVRKEDEKVYICSAQNNVSNYVGTPETAITELFIKGIDPSIVHCKVKLIIFPFYPSTFSHTRSSCQRQSYNSCSWRVCYSTVHSFASISPRQT